MKQIIRVYGEFLYYAAAFGIVLTMMLYGIRDGYGNTGAFQLIGGKMPVSQREYRDCADFERFQADAAVDTPKIMYGMPAMVYAGQPVLQADLLTARDAAGASLPVWILDVYDQAGAVCTDQCQITGGTITFPREGIYRILAVAWDGRKKHDICRIWIPVNA